MASLFLEELIIDDIRVRAIGGNSGITRRTIPRQNEAPKLATYSQTYFEGGRVNTPVFKLGELKAGCEIDARQLLLITSTIIRKHLQ